jgi:NAD(P)H-dependent flavin oxidoreductase YrpB (nitropropane dioxygenase family)
MAKNRICELLSIRYPVIQAPMNWVAGAELAAAVSNAGGLGTLGPNAGADSITTDVELTGERMREQIKRVKSLTDKPFAVNVAVLAGGSTVYSQKIVQVVMEEKVPVAIVSVGRPDVYTETLKDAGIKVLHAISTATHARNAEKTGVDGVICEGYEAGGHKGLTELTTFILTPMVADAVKIPVITGGGIGDARGVMAAMALGADGVYMGTRFMVTKESESHAEVKEMVVKGEEACTVTLDKGFMQARDLRNSYTEKFTKMIQSGTSAEELMKFGQGMQYRAQHLGEAEDAEVCCGQVAALIDSVKSAQEIVEEMAKGISVCFKELKEKLDQFM